MTTCRIQEELLYLVLQFLKEENRPNVLHRLEAESQIFFNLEYVGLLASKGDWEAAEAYVSAFIKPEDGAKSRNIFFLIIKQKYLEALYQGDDEKAVGILDNELKPFEASHKREFKEIRAMRKFRGDQLSSRFGDIESVRTKKMEELVKLISDVPELQRKLMFPNIQDSRLQTVINQSLHRQNSGCRNPSSSPVFRSLSLDQACEQHGGITATSSFPLHPSMGLIPNADASPPVAPATVPLQLSGSSWMTSQYPVNHFTFPSAPSSAARLLNAENQIATSGVSKKQKQAENLSLLDQLPLTVVMSVSHDSAVSSMDFHPAELGLLLVGTASGGVMIWDLISRKMLMQREFRIWDVETSSMSMQAAMADSCTPSVNRVKWSSDGSHFGVAYSKFIVHIYTCRGREDSIEDFLEIEAHPGSVNDVAFANQSDQHPWVITCGDDKTVKVWESFTGGLKYCFQGHEAPVYAVCSQRLDDDHQVLFSTDARGTVRVWLYEDPPSARTFVAPHYVVAKITFSADGGRMFLGGTSQNGVSCIVELDESDGSMKHAYEGLAMPSVGFVQYDVAKGGYLAAVDEHMVKFWGVDDGSLLKMTDAGGELPTSPCMGLDKEGTFMAVTTSGNGIKILANAAGKRILHTMAKRALDASRAAAAVQLRGPNVMQSSKQNMSSGQARRKGKTPLL
uniref:CTLH domain-containing protein n=1 Tax=Kalanchoe fedtschenkoi TaxID=63787 RepID=A0A7N1A9E8_KALFE